MQVTFRTTNEQLGRWQANYALLQLNYVATSPRWKMMIACILLNRTKRAQVDKVIDKLFDRYISPTILANANQEHLMKMLQPLGFQAQRSKSLVRYSKELMNIKRGPYTDGTKWGTSHTNFLLQLEEMSGIGEYALDSYAIFVLGNINIRPKDKELLKYVIWLGADVSLKKEKRYAILAGHVVSQYDGDLHWVNARQLVRLYNLDPEECILLEGPEAWNKFNRQYEPSRFKVLSTRHEGDYERVHTQLMIERLADDKSSRS